MARDLRSAVERSAGLDCACCKGLPVCWVARDGRGLPARLLCVRHLRRWERAERSGRLWVM